MNNSRDKVIARRTAELLPWLASIVCSPHLPSPRLQAAASSHLLHAAGFKVTRHHEEPGQQAPKRRKLLHQRHHSPPKQQLPDGLEQLHQAACTDDVAKIEQLLSRKDNAVDVNAPSGPSGRTALHAAAASGSVAACQALLSHGADSNCADDDNASPLMLAAAGGHEGVVKVLLEAGADPWHVDYKGVNPLMSAARCGSSACTKLLLSKGVDADYANSELGGGEHALLLAAESGSVATVGLLLAGARLNRTDKAGRSALWVAARNGHGLVVQQLLSQPGVKHISSFGACSTTPLQEAQAAHHSTVIAMLSSHLQRQQQEHQQQRLGQQHAVQEEHGRKATGSHTSNSSSAIKLSSSGC